MGFHANRFFRREKKHKDKWKEKGKHSPFVGDVSFDARTDWSVSGRQEELDCRSSEEGALHSFHCSGWQLSLSVCKGNVL